MKNLKKISLFFLFSTLILSTLLLLTGQADAELKFGGVLRYAMIDSPPTLDQHAVTSDLSTTIAQHWSEGLYAYNAKYEPAPLLAKSDEIKEDGKLVVIHLREGVPFHNGKEMTSEDVVASLKHWGEYGVRGPIVFKHVDRLEADGKYTVKIYFKEVFSPWKSLFACINGGPTIYPKEVVENATKEPIPRSGYIGTGPYQFIEWNEGRYILLKRFDKYAARDEAPDGYVGKRVAYFDEIRFIPVPDSQTRVNGVLAGDYDYAEYIPGDLYESLKQNPSVVVVLNQGAMFGTLFFNSTAGIMSQKGPVKDNWMLRRAILTALDMEPVLRAAAGPQDLWRLNGSIMPPGTFFYSEAGTKYYSQGNIEKAKQMAKEAGYNGEKIVYMSTTSYDHIYNYSVVIESQLKKAGFNIDFQIYDWATLVARRVQPNLWDLFQTSHGFVPDPILYTFMSDAYPGWWTTEKKTRLTNEFTGVSDPKERKAIWDQIQALVYEEVPICKVGDQYHYDISSPKVQGIGETQLIWPKMWGVAFK
jgi:peptide/nickel transport system substrate-binding protein